MKYKLVIWDFDGVLADSEKIYMYNRQSYFNDKLHLNFDLETTIKYFGGLSDFTNRTILEELGYKTDDAFWKNLSEIDMDIIRKGLPTFKNIEDTLSVIPKQCIATGGVLSKTLEKIKAVGFWNKYFNISNTFTVDMVKKGKPEPDLFLYAARQMKESPADCIVIEDSIAGMTAAQRAGIDVIAFLGCEMYQNDTYLQRVKDLGIQHICYTMPEVEKIILDS
ncbi:MAG: HAD family phosphatase [Alphaproteobacteria bacterium]|nr:HAD family phosphatase [Alphaproteobacteria bacterium]